MEGEPSKHVLPLSPLPFSTLIPAPAAVARIESRLWTSASVVWSSQYVQELLMTETPSSIIWLKRVWKLVLKGAS